MKYDYVLVGAGLFNAVFASIATSNGKRCLVLEKDSHVGGQCYTRTENGICIHEKGAHIFYTDDKEVWRYVNQYAEFLNFVNCPIAKFKGEVYNLPFNMNTFSKMFGVFSPDEARSVLKEKTRKLETEPKNLEEHAISIVGEDVYLKLIKEYTEKQWGKKCSELPASIMRRIPVRFTYNNSYYDAKYQGIPSSGYTDMICNMLKRSDVECSHMFKKEDAISGRTVIYTGAIDEYFEYSEGFLEWRSLRFEEVWYDTDNWQGNAVVNYTSNDVPYTRTIEHKHFTGVCTDKTVVSYEYPTEWKIGSEKYYPIETFKNLEVLRKYQEKASKEKNIVFAGRLGSYKYTNMQDTVRNAIDLYKRLENEHI